MAPPPLPTKSLSSTGAESASASNPIPLSSSSTVTPSSLTPSTLVPTSSSTPVPRRNSPSPSLLPGSEDMRRRTSGAAFIGMARQWSRGSGSGQDKTGASSSPKSSAAQTKMDAAASAPTGGEQESRRKRLSRLIKGATGASKNTGSHDETLAPVGKPKLAKALVKHGRRAILGAVEDEHPMFSAHSADYTLLAPIGFGASSTVYLAHFKPLHDRACAVKVVDVDRLGGGDVERLKKETQLMSLAKHPNILRVRGEWIHGSKLFIAVRLMASGSLHDIMRYQYPEGFSEDVIATVLCQVLEGIHYLHINGWIHRDIKAANLLVDDDGTVLVSDFGVSGNLDCSTSPSPSKGTDGPMEDENGPKTSRSPSRNRRTSFVGTPCWMAPEVVQGQEYNDKADIWSFGITALELALGRAPLSLYPPARVLAKTVTESPPTLPLSRPGSPHAYSRTFKSMIDGCLAKDPLQRPSAASLLDHGFFSRAKKKDFLVGAVLKGLPPLTARQQERVGVGTGGRGERRGLSEVSHTSTTSWDFASTIGRSAASLRWRDVALDGEEGRGDGGEGRREGSRERRHSRSRSSISVGTGSIAIPEEDDSSAPSSVVAPTPDLGPVLSSRSTRSEEGDGSTSYSTDEAAPSGSDPQTPSMSFGASSEASMVGSDEAIPPVSLGPPSSSAAADVRLDDEAGSPPAGEDGAVPGKNPGEEEGVGEVAETVGALERMMARA